AFDNSGVPWAVFASSDSVSGDTLRIGVLKYPYYTNKLRYSLDEIGYTNTRTDDNSYDSLTATSSTPIFRFSSRYSANSYTPIATWKGKSSRAASSSNILLQIYRYGTTNAWETLTTNSSCSANAGCTLI